MKTLSLLLLLTLGLGAAWWTQTHPGGTLDDLRADADALLERASVTLERARLATAGALGLALRDGGATGDGADGGATGDGANAPEAAPDEPDTGADGSGASAETLPGDVSSAEPPAEATGTPVSVATSETGGGAALDAAVQRRVGRVEERLDTLDARLSTLLERIDTLERSASDAAVGGPAGAAPEPADGVPDEAPDDARP